jgi:hypothetical protein
MSAHRRGTCLLTRAHPAHRDIWNLEYDLCDAGRERCTAEPSFECNYVRHIRTCHLLPLIFTAGAMFQWR